MISLGVRLSIGGGREAFVRLIAIAAGVMIGTTLLLFVISGLRVAYGQSNRPCWQCTSENNQHPSVDETKSDPLLLTPYREEIVSGKQIASFDVATKGPRAPIIPGLNRMPEPGEYVVSPALAKLMNQIPADQLANRFPGKLSGIIGDAGLQSPSSLIAVIGYTAEELSRREGVIEVKSLESAPKKQNFNPFLTVLMIVGVLGVIFSVTTLIATATRLSAARREEKFAALRLFGATPRQVNSFAAIDAALGAGIGALLGIGLFYTIQPLLVRALSSVVSFFPQDLQPGLAISIGVAIAIPIIAATAALIALRRVRISPLGVARRTVPKQPGIWRLIPFILGMVIVTVVWYLSHGIQNDVEKSKLAPYFAVGFGLVMVGILTSGPLFTMLSAKLLARRARTASSLLALRRLGDNPKGAFRSVSVLVVVVFLGTAAATVIPVVIDDQSDIRYGIRQEDEEVAYSPAELKRISSSLRQEITGKFEKIPGTTAITMYPDKADPSLPSSGDIILCDDYAKLTPSTRFPKAYRCPTGATAMLISNGGYDSVIDPQKDIKPLKIDPQSITSRTFRHIKVRFAKSDITANRVRTVAAQYSDVFNHSGFFTFSELRAKDKQSVLGVASIINAALLFVIFIAACGLTISVSSGLIERKRAFGLLRVTGASFSQLAKVVCIESVIPFLGAAVLAAGLGFGIIALMISAFMQDPIVSLPYGPYFIIMGAGIVIAAATLLATLPLMAATTKPDKVRFE